MLFISKWILKRTESANIKNKTKQKTNKNKCSPPPLHPKEPRNPLCSVVIFTFTLKFRKRDKLAKHKVKTNNFAMQWLDGRANVTARQTFTDTKMNTLKRSVCPNWGQHCHITIGGGGEERERERERERRERETEREKQPDLRYCSRCKLCHNQHFNCGQLSTCPSSHPKQKTWLWFWTILTMIQKFKPQGQQQQQESLSLITRSKNYLPYQACTRLRSLHPFGILECNRLTVV